MFTDVNYNYSSRLIVFQVGLPLRLCVLFIFFSLFVANSRSVSWLLGRDGDVQVIVIGEMDELKSSKIIYSGFGERKTASVLNNSRYGCCATPE